MPAIEHHPALNPRRSGWLAVAVFFAAYAVSFLDRQIISLLVVPLKQSLGISDTQIGLLQGPAFGVFYALLGMPLGILADRMNRAHLIALAIALWSAMTVASGLTSSFSGLLLARMGVGIGEAALVPAAVSLLAELFSPQRRALPLAVFTSGIAIGAGLSLTLGAALIAVTSGDLGAWPVLGSLLAGRQPWQATFILAGLVGLPVALCAACIPDPRTASARMHAHGPAGLGLLLRHLQRQRTFFVPLLLAVACLYLVSNATSAWLPTLLQRKFGWTAIVAGSTLGWIILVCALIGNIGSGLLTTAWRLRGQKDASVRTMLLGVCVLAPMAIAAPLLTASTATLLGIAATYLGVALCFGIATTAIVEVTPPELRGQMVALYLLVGNLVGLGLGPPSVGVLMDHAPPPFNTVGAALASCCAIVAVPAIALLLQARRRFIAAQTEPA
jgi:MFS family permease